MEKDELFLDISKREIEGMPLGGLVELLWDLKNEKIENIRKLNNIDTTQTRTAIREDQEYARKVELKYDNKIKMIKDEINDLEIKYSTNCEDDCKNYELQ
jgi:hypothetical protein